MIATPEPSLLDPALAERVSSLQVEARRIAEGAVGGLHRSPHRGASVVFVDHREYRPGDDPRWLDWRAFARNDRPSIKRFEQEAQLRCLLAIDVSGSMWFGGARGPSKIAHAARLVGALSYLLSRQGDAFGLATFASNAAFPLPVASRASQLDALAGLLASTLSGEPPTGERRATDLASCFAVLAEALPRRTVLVLASDFLDLSPSALDPLSVLASRGHEILALQVLTAEEIDLPYESPARFVGLESEPAEEVDPVAIRTGYLDEIARVLDETRSACLAAGARYVLARTDAAPEETLATLLGRARSAR